MRLAGSTSRSAGSSAVLPIVFRYTRTRSVDTSPVESGSRRGERTSRVSLGEDCSRVTGGLRPCLRFGCLPAVVLVRRCIPASEGPRESPVGALSLLLSVVVRRAQRSGPGLVFHERR